MDETPMGTWTNHHSLVEYDGQWYLFYHNSAYSPKFDKNRSVCIDSLFFNPDGTIQKVIPTHRGVGLTSASSRIEFDRFSNISQEGASIAYIDTLDAFKGWKTVLDKQNGWISYNAVDFGSKKVKKVNVNAVSPSGSILEIRLDNAGGPVIAQVKVPATTEWTTVSARVKLKKRGVQNLVMVLKGENPVETDWVSFK